MNAPATRIETESVDCVVCGSAGCAAVGTARDFEYGTCENEFRFVSCTDCGHVYLKDRPVRQSLETIYPAGYGNYDGRRTRALTFRVKGLLDERRLTGLFRLAPRVDDVLDIGCADGRLLDLCRRLRPASELHGVEITERAADAATRKGYPVMIGTIDEMALPSRAYDFIFLQQVIEHVYSPDLVCRKVRDSLRPSGVAVFETPTTDCLDFRLFRRRYWGGYHVPRHFNLFSERGLLRLCRRAGLELVRVRYTPQPIHWVWTLRHALEESGVPRRAYQALHMTNPIAMGCGTLLEILSKAATGRMSNLELVVRRPGERAAS